MIIQHVIKVKIVMGYLILVVVEVFEVPCVFYTEAHFGLD